jgi:hypothetical protein
MKIIRLIFYWNILYVYTQDCNLEFNTTYLGNSFASTFVMNVNDCCNACKSRPGCYYIINLNQ